jgi:hypothetical protein
VNSIPPNILKRKTKGLLVKYKEGDPKEFFDSPLGILQSIRSGKLSLDDFYFNECSNSWEELNKLDFLKNKLIPFNKKNIDKTDYNIDLTPPKIPLVNKKERYIFAN